MASWLVLVVSWAQRQPGGRRLGDLAERGFRRRFGRLFGFSFRSSARPRLLAEPAALLASHRPGACRGSAATDLARVAASLVTPYQFLSGQMLYWLGNLLVVALFAGLAMIFGELFMSHRGEERFALGEPASLGSALETILAALSSPWVPSRPSRSRSGPPARFIRTSLRLCWRCSACGCTNISGSRPGRRYRLVNEEQQHE